MSKLATICEAADELGMSRQAVSELVRVLGIETQPIKYNGRARGLTAFDIQVIRATIDAGRRKAERRRLAQPA